MEILSLFFRNNSISNSLKTISSIGFIFYKKNEANFSTLCHLILYKNIKKKIFYKTMKIEKMIF